MSGVTCGYTDQCAASIKYLSQCVDFKLKNRSVSSESLLQSIESLGKAYFLAGELQQRTDYSGNGVA